MTEAEKPLDALNPLREHIAKAIWDFECPQENDGSTWPANAEIQPYCQSTYREAEFIMRRLSMSLTASPPEVAPAPGLREVLSQKLREVFKVSPPGEFVGERQILDAIMDVIARAALKGASKG